MPSKRLIELLLVLCLVTWLGACSRVQLQWDFPPWVILPEHKDPALLDAYRHALLALREGDRELATLRLQQIIDDKPHFVGPRINLGILHMRHGDYRAAEKAFRGALEVQPDNAIAHNQLGLLHRYRGEFEQAEAAYLAALAARPDYGLAHRNLGVLYDLYLQQADKALPHYQRSRELAGETDKELTIWIAEVQQRINTEKTQ